MAENKTPRIDALRFNSVTTAERDALPSPAEGYLVYNSDTDSLNQYQNAAWVNIASGTGSTNLSYTPSPTDGTVTSDTGTDATLTLASGTNAGLLSPTDYSNLQNIIVSDITGVAGADQINNIISLTQAEYDAIGAPDANTQYIITDAVTASSEITYDNTISGLTATDVKAALDEIEGRVDTNDAKVTNATHTGEVTGSGALTLDPTAITGKTTETAVAGDFILFSDTSDSGNLKKLDATDVLGGGAGGDVSKVGTPVDNQIGVWTGDGTIEGTTSFTWDEGTNTLSLDDSAGSGPVINMQSTFSATDYDYSMNWLNGTFYIDWAQNAGWAQQLRLGNAGIYPGTTNVLDIGTTTFRLKDIWLDGTIHTTNAGNSTDWYNTKLEHGVSVLNTGSLAAIAEADCTDGELRVVRFDNAIYIYDSGASSGDVAPSDQTGGTGFWILIEGIDITNDIILDNGTGNSPSIGVSNTFDTSTQWDVELINGFAYLGITDGEDLLWGDAVLRPNTTNVFDLGTGSFRYKDGYFTGTVSATGGFSTGGASTSFLKADGSVDTNTYLEPHGIYEFNTNQTTVLAHANGTVNFTSGAALTYTLAPNATIAHPVGTRIIISNEGATTVTITEGAAVTFIGGDPVLTEGESAYAIQTVADEWLIVRLKDREVFTIPCGDLTTTVTTGTSKGYIRIPYAFEVTKVRASILTPGTTTGMDIDINEGGTTILSTTLTTDATEGTTETAATPAVISDSTLAADAEITVDFDGVPTGGAGVVVYLEGYRIA